MKYIVLFVFTVSLVSFNNYLIAQESTEISQEDLKNIVHTLPLQLTQKSISIGYERLLSSNKIGINVYGILALKDRTKDLNLELRYYLNRSQNKSYNIGIIDIQNCFFEHFVGISGTHLSKPGYLYYKSQVIGGSRIQLQSNFNFSIYLVSGPGYIIKERFDSGEKTYYTTDLRVSVGLRF